MSGILVNVLSKTDFNFSGVGSTTVETTLARALNAVPYREGVLIVRVHSKSNTGSGTSVQDLFVHVREAAPSSDDPATEFVGNSIASAQPTMNGGTTGAQPPLFVQLSSPLPPFLRVVVAPEQSVAGSTFTCSLSVDLVLRE